MIDRPNAQELLAAMAATLTNDVMPALDGGPRHSARVVANLCGILAREWEARGEVPVAELRALLGHEAGTEGPDYADLVAELDRRLSSSGPETDELAIAALPIVMADVEQRLAVDKPGYSQP